MKTQSYRLWLAVLTASVALTGSEALAIDNGACCVQSTSRLETLLNPNKGSDENFFTAAGGPPNVMFILDTSCSMNAWPTDWPSARGCNHPGFAGNGYDPNTDYRGFISGMTGNPKTPTFDNDWFDDEKVYRAGGSATYNTSTIGHDFRGAGAPGGTSYAPLGGGTPLARLLSAANVACAATAPANLAACVTCIQNAGYYVENGSTRLASGNYLEFYSPRDVSAVMTLSQLLFDVREIRLGIMTFDNWSGSVACQAPGNSDGPTCLWKALGPNCNQLYPFDQSSVDSQRNSIMNALAGNNPFNAHTPLATNLYMAGFHMRAAATSPDGYDALFAGAFPGNTALNEPNSPNQRSICTGCSFNAVIILTDGEPNDEVITSYPPEITGLTSLTAPSCPAATGACDSYLDEIAAFLWTQDLRPDLNGKQSIATYTIGFGTNANANQLLASAAKVGGGKYFPASGSAAVREALLSILDDINSRNNSFASAAVASVQTGSSSSPALLPRMLPKKGQPWQGQLWRFEQYNEFVEDADLNGDADKEDVFVVEQTATPTAANIVTELADGTFVKNATTTPATPYWEANERLVTNLAANVDDRKVWTIVDSNGDGAFTSADTLTRFQGATAADDLKMAEYMGIRGSAFCPSATTNGSILARFGMSLAAAQTAVGFTLPGVPTQADRDRLCARVIMKWVSGADFFDADGDGNFAEVRQNVLGDLFHSSPVLIDPPIDPFLCNLGLSNQCARTLFSQQLTTTPTPVATQAVGTSVCGVTNLPAYEAWAFDSRRRDKLVVVGSNDGMIHAFVSGRYASETCVGGQPVPVFNKGTGDEAWAFIPPDLLPKLPDLILTHEYMVDGDIMVRDIWAEGASPNGSKEKNEFHSMAIVSEGRGGKHYIALEMMFQASGQVRDRPGFRWMFPQPCSEESATFGKTFFSLSPKAPPVGPMLIDDASLPGSSNIAAATPVSRYGVDTHERWVVALSGGWSPALEKGRGIYVVDAWDGQINGRRDNLWWKFEFNDSASGTETPARELTNSVAAPVSLVDYGDNDSPSQDGFFDTAVFADTAGQIWVSRLFAPGTFNPSTARIDNWFTGRAFEMDREGLPGASTATTLPDGGTEPLDPNAKSIVNKAPFFYLPSVAIEPGNNKLRVFAGTGNRYAILEAGAGLCRFDNPVACSKSRADDVKFVSKYKDAVVDIGKAETHWKSRRFEHGKLDKSVSIGPTVALTAADTCGSAGNKRVEAENDEGKIGNVDLTSGPDPSPGEVNKIKYECGLDALGNSFTCTQQGSATRLTGDLLDQALVDTSGLGMNRFVGFWAYGGTQSDGGFRGFGGTSGVTNTQYDTRRVSDRTTALPINGNLVNVTRVGCAADQSCDGGAQASDFGWFIDYNALDQKTATGGAVIASCVLWSDMSPTGGDGGLCAAGVTPLSRIYQSDFITGQPNCAFGFLPLDGGAYARSQARTVVAPPPEPASVVQVSKTGEVRYSAMIVEPGKGQATSINVSGGQDVLQFVYEVPVSRSLHNCRHADAGCSTVP